MLFLVLVLVLAALGLLVTALITANSLWAWASIGLSVLAGVVLVVDYFRRRARRRRADKVTVAAAMLDREPVAESDEAAGSETTAEEPETAEATEPEAAPATGDPAQEQSAPADIDVVSGLEVEVVVVDEHPRYHLTECEWLGERDTIPIAVKEARDLGFTPCGRCTPDAKLAQAHRASAH